MSSSGYSDDTIMSELSSRNGWSGLKSLLDPMRFSTILFVGLVLFVLYLLLPRGVRKQYFGAYLKRHAWSARSRRSLSQPQQPRNSSGQVSTCSALTHVSYRTIRCIDLAPDSTLLSREKQPLPPTNSVTV